MGHFSVEIMRLPGQLSVEINTGCLELTSRRQQARHLPTATVTPRPAIFIW